ncbi:uncharacterized protein LOC142985191 isoform X10 [Anticarsia gemmatalis]|uniref:uncharacterized protein LOC142985191 isoform X10 n=1 Tax=Anticarsia gemmatalis TaxID=129554 RepID=UPI003F774EEE
MDFEQIVVKEGPGLCRCCLTEGCYKDLGKEYTWMNETEVYADMLLECFDISITQHNEGPNGPNRLICEVCITRLRDACYFKKQVQDSEKKFIDMMGRGEFRSKNAGATDTVVIFQQQMKTEAASDVPANVVDAEVEFLDEEIGFADDAEDDDTIEDPEPSVSDITVSSLPIKGKRGRPKKTTAKTDKKAKIAKLDDKPKAVKSIGKERSNSKIIEERRKEQLATILPIIFQSTTILPFRWHKSKYMCFFCRSLFIESSKLKQHTDSQHTEINIKEIILRTFYRKSRIKIDVSDLWCSRCQNQIANFKEYIRHLGALHGIFIDKETSQFFDCFSLSDDAMHCLDCGQYFRFFGPLLLHKHKYHTDHFLCEICGQGFVAKTNLENHVKQIHGIKSCKDCNMTFPTQYSLANHIENVHRKDKLKCPLCPEVLGNRYLKKRHMALVHDCKSYQIVCELCAKIFTRNNKYVQHKMRVHFKEKNCTCEVCGHKAFNVDALNRHKVCHDETKPYICEFCDKTFRRKRTLLIHMRTH